MVGGKGRKVRGMRGMGGGDRGGWGLLVWRVLCNTFIPRRLCSICSSVQR